MAIVLHHSKAKGTAKLVLVGIANHAGDGGAWPAVTTLARYANVTERNVQKAIEQLIGMGELTRHVQRGGTLDSHAHDWERPNRYDILLSCPAWCDRTPHHRPRPGWESADAALTAAQPMVLVDLPGKGADAPEAPPSPRETPVRNAPKPAAPPPAELLQQTRAAVAQAREAGYQAEAQAAAAEVVARRRR